MNDHWETVTSNETHNFQIMQKGSPTGGGRWMVRKVGKTSGKIKQYPGTMGTRDGAVMEAKTRAGQRGWV